MKIPSPIAKSAVVFTPVVKAAGWLRSEYPTAPPCGHIALVALCCKPTDQGDE